MTGKSRASTRLMSAWDKKDPPVRTVGLSQRDLRTGWAATDLPPPSPGLPFDLLPGQHDPPEGGFGARRERRVPRGYRGCDADVPAGVHDALVGLRVAHAEDDERRRQQEE